MAKKRANGDVCERCRRQMKRAKRSVSNKEYQEVKKKMEIVQQEDTRSARRQVDFYNWDAIISVGCRVNSSRTTHFRIWATGILKEYMINGFALDDTRLKQGRTTFSKDYFRELLKRVRSIRTSVRRIWQRISNTPRCQQCHPHRWGRVSISLTKA